MAQSRELTPNNSVNSGKSLRCTPAMAAGVTKKLWSFEDIVALLD